MLYGEKSSMQWKSYSGLYWVWFIKYWSYWESTVIRSFKIHQVFREWFSNQSWVCISKTFNFLWKLQTTKNVLMKLLTTNLNTHEILSQYLEIWYVLEIYDKLKKHEFLDFIENEDDGGEKKSQILAIGKLVLANLSVIVKL